jgi:hypothetical protein
VCYDVDECVSNPCGLLPKGETAPGSVNNGTGKPCAESEC